MKASIEQCAESCKGVSSMFIFGTNDFGWTWEGWWHPCNDEGCSCYCEISAKDNGTCDMQANEGFRLYKFLSSGKNWMEIHGMLQMTFYGILTSIKAIHQNRYF